MSIKATVSRENHILALFTLLVSLSTSIAHAGFIFDDPLEMIATPKRNTFSKDELTIMLTGKHELWLVLQPEVTLELRYSDGTTKLVAAQNMFSKNSPLTFTLPKPYSQLNSFVLTGKFLGVGTVEFSDKGKLSFANGQRYDFKPKKGYKIDSKWVTK
jgi:hypothetical protein